MLMAEYTGQWTLAEFDRLPTDSNKYELIDGVLFVTPAPSYPHERLLSVLNNLLLPYVMEHKIGLILRPRSEVRALGSAVEPDLQVRPDAPSIEVGWEFLPMPLLVVEAASRTTRRRDNTEKRDFYMRCGIAEYWIVDREQRNIRVITAGAPDAVQDQQLLWQPVAGIAPLTIDVVAYFREALG